MKRCTRCRAAFAIYMQGGKVAEGLIEVSVLGADGIWRHYHHECAPS
jgi:hypothetical protein